MQYTIYTLSCSKTGDIRYVGITTQSLKSRFYGHLYNSRNIKQTSTPVSKWIKSLKGKVDILELDKVTREYWEISEQYWIAQLRQWGFKLLNLDKGGVGIVRGVRPNTIEMKKKPVTIYTWEGEKIKDYCSISEARKDLELKSSSSITNILSSPGKYKRNLVANNNRVSWKGRAPSPLTIILANGKRFLNIAEASKELKFCRSKASQYLKGLRGPIKGLEIKYDIV